MTTNGTRLRLSPLILLNPEYKTCYPVSVGIAGNSRLSNNSWASSRADTVFSSMHKEKNGFFSSDSSVFPPEKIKENLEVEQELKPLWDDGYGSQTVKDYLEAAKNMINSDGGPPRWFCPIESGPPLKNSPVLLYLPGTSLRFCKESKKKISMRKLSFFLLIALGAPHLCSFNYKNHVFRIFVLMQELMVLAWDSSCITRPLARFSKSDACMFLFMIEPHTRGW